MRAVLKGALAAALIAGTSVAGTAPAEAHDRGGTAVIAGLLGLGIGAAIASDNHHYRDHYRDYGSGYGYDNGRAYYTPAYGDGYENDRGYYRDRHYRDRDYYDRRGWDDRGYYGR